MKILDIIYDEVLGSYNKLVISENIAQAEKLLKNYNIPLDHPKYLELKDYAIKNGNIRFLGHFLSLSLYYVNQPNIELFNATSHLYEALKTNGPYLKLLPKNIFEYKDYKELLGDLNNLGEKSNCTKFGRLIINKEVKNELLNQCGKSSTIDYPIRYYLEKIEGTSLSNAFKKKINRHKNVGSLLDNLNLIIKFHKDGFIYEDWKNRINNNTQNFKLLYDDSENERMLVHTKSWEGVKQIGSPSWCIYSSNQQFNEYTDFGNENLYVFLNFTADDLNYSIIGFTMNEEGEVTASHLMDDTHIDNIKNYLNKIGVLYRFVILNSEISKIKKNKTLTDTIKTYSENVNDDFIIDYMSDYLNYVDKLLGIDNQNRLSIHRFPTAVIGGEQISYKNKKYVENFYIENINDSYFKINSKDLFKSTLIDYLNIFQNFIIGINNIDEDSSYFSSYIKVNLFGDNLYPLFPVSDMGEKKEMINESLIDVFIRYKDMKQETYNWFIKKLIELNGREKIFDIIRRRKERNSEEYSNVEFTNIKDKKNMVSYIVNKIQNARREGVIDLTPQEVKYGVENGLKNQLQKLYTSLIPYFRENQIDYDSMEIFKSLGMIKELTDAVVYKVNFYGDEKMGLQSLNSIENSLYQYRNKL